ncbi:HU family DNA-binding protein [Actinomadura opuntiae]|uniref:HU family DNA-binding protein n=1 Tax=Actinomadura sp. OS1-43 TaxID=604315 RepID=UPI003342BBAD
MCGSTWRSCAASWSRTRPVPATCSPNPAWATATNRDPAPGPAAPPTWRPGRIQGFCRSRWASLSERNAAMEAGRMNRSELVKAVAERAGGDEAVARRHVDAVFEAVMDAVSAGERVVVTGFGAFDRSARPARSARNPRTGAAVEVPAALVPTFRFGQTFRNRVAQSPAETASTAEAVAVEAAAVEAAPAAEDAPAPSKKPKKGKKAAASKAAAKKAPEKAPKKGKKAAAADPAPKKKGGKAKAKAKGGK